MLATALVVCWGVWIVTGSEGSAPGDAQWPRPSGPWYDGSFGKLAAWQGRVSSALTGVGGTVVVNTRLKKEKPMKLPSAAECLGERVESLRGNMI